MNNSKEETSSKLYICPYSHLDLFWGGNFEECLSRGNHIIARSLELLDEQPEFCFMIETVNFLDNYLECFPYELERIKKHVLSDRLFIGAMWSATYQNITDGELLVRNIIYAREYIRDKFGIDQDIVNIGDLPGYTPQFPAIAKHCGINKLMFTRCGSKIHPLFHWQALDGSKCLTWFIKINYSGLSHADLHENAEKINWNILKERFDTIFDNYDYPAFAHLGSDLWGPSSNYVTNLDVIKKRFQNISMKIATPKTFFDAVESIPDLSILKGDIPSAWPHVESSWPQLWPLVAPAAEALKCAELFNTIKSELFKSAYPVNKFRNIYKRLLNGCDHNQNGQGGTQANIEKASMISISQHDAEELTANALRSISASIAISDACSAIIVFNPLPWERTEYIESRIAFFGTVKSLDMGFSEDSLGSIRNDLCLFDADGKEVSFQVIDERGNISRGMEVGFIASVPSCGYSTYYFRKGTPAQHDKLCREIIDNESRKKVCRPEGIKIYETDTLRLEINELTGDTSVYNKRAERFICRNMKISGIEEYGGDYIMKTNPSGREFPFMLESVRLTLNNPLKSQIEISGCIGNIRILQKLILFRDSSKVRIENSIHWKTGTLLRIQQIFGVAGKITYDVPCGKVTYPDIMPGCGPAPNTDEIDYEFWRKVRLVNNRLTVDNNDFSISIAMTHRLVEIEENLLRCYMVRGAKYCSAPQYGDFENQAVSHPPTGTYTAVYVISDDSNIDIGSELQSPLKTMPKLDNNQHGNLPLQQSFCKCGDLKLSSIQCSNDGTSVVGRFYNDTGKKLSSSISVMDKTPYVEVNAEEKIINKIKTDKIKFNPYQIKTFKLR